MNQRKPKSVENKSSRVAPAHSCSVVRKVKKVLIAEDAHDLAWIYETVFRKCGYEVKTVSDGEAAIQTLTKSVWMPDVILLDIMMPKATGFEVLAEIKKKDSTVKHVPVLAMTNLVSLINEKEDLKKIKSLGANDVVFKSQVDPLELVKKVELIISKSS